MLYSAYPTGSDVYNYLRQSGLDKASVISQPELLSNCQAAAAAAAAEWEERVQWFPFLSSGNAAEVRVFDGPGSNVLDLQSGLLLLSAVTVGSFNFPATVTATTAALVTPKPANAPSRNRPYTSLALGLVSPVGGLDSFDTALFASGYLSFIPAIRSLVSVTGLWGKFSAVPADVFRAIAVSGAALLWPELQSGRNGGVASVKDETMQVQFLEAAQSPFGAKFEQLAQYHRRISLG